MKFPKNFKFGVADADLQVIGEKNTLQFENSQPTMWTHFSQSSDKVYKNQTPLEGIDRYHLWKSDTKYMKQLGIQSYRTSISMARILKQNGDVNKEALLWYINYFRAIKKAGIDIFATLYHWELPQYLEERGGWKNKEIISIFLRHAQIVVENLGEFISEYFILNEPRCSSLVGYYIGAHPPAEKNLKDALTVAHNLLLAQGIVANELSSKYKNILLSTALNMAARYAYTTSVNDIIATKNMNGHKNLWFTDPIFLGQYPEFMVELYGKNMPQVTKEEMKIIKIGDKLNSFGLNYYKGDLLVYNSKNDIKAQVILQKNGPTTDLGWPIFVPPYYPEGLYDTLVQIYYLYKDHGLKQIYVTENGIAVKSKLKNKSLVPDKKRISYMRDHLRQAEKAIKAGIPLTAYFAWTLMDNFEWAEGYRPESAFGLIHVDRKTMIRTPKESYYWYKNFINSSK